MSIDKVHMHHALSIHLGRTPPRWEGPSDVRATMRAGDMGLARKRSLAATSRQRQTFQPESINQHALTVATYNGRGSRQAERDLTRSRCKQAGMT